MMHSQIFTHHADMFTKQEMMYIWNGYTVIGKHKDLTEGMLQTLNEAQQKIEQSSSKIIAVPIPRLDTSKVTSFESEDSVFKGYSLSVCVVGFGGCIFRRLRPSKDSIFEECSLRRLCPSKDSIFEGCSLRMLRPSEDSD